MMSKQPAPTRSTARHCLVHRSVPHNRQPARMTKCAPDNHTHGEQPSARPSAKQTLNTSVAKNTPFTFLFLAQFQLLLLRTLSKPQKWSQS